MRLSEREINHKLLFLLSNLTKIAFLTYVVEQTPTTVV
jgi:hypothetical protein